MHVGRAGSWSAGGGRERGVTRGGGSAPVGGWRWRRAGAVPRDPTVGEAAGPRHPRVGRADGPGDGPRPAHAGRAGRPRPLIGMVMRPSVRKLALTLHLTCSLGWIGAVV